MSQCVFSAIVLGSSEVGKSTFVETLRGPQGILPPLPTTHAEFCQLHVPVRLLSDLTHVVLWDTPSFVQPTERLIIETLLGSCEGVILCFDPSRVTTLEDIERTYHPLVLRKVDVRTPIMLLSLSRNHALGATELMTNERGNTFAREHGMIFAVVNDVPSANRSLENFVSQMLCCEKPRISAKPKLGAPASLSELPVVTVDDCFMCFQRGVLKLLQDWKRAIYCA